MEFSSDDSFQFLRRVEPGRSSQVDGLSLTLRVLKKKKER